MNYVGVGIKNIKFAIFYLYTYTVYNLKNTTPLIYTKKVQKIYSILRLYFIFISKS